MKNQFKDSTNMENEIKENETEEIIELNDNIFYSPKEFSKLRQNFCPKKYISSGITASWSLLVR